MTFRLVALNARGLSLVEALVSVVILGLIGAGFTSLFGFMASENHYMSDKAEATDLQRQFAALLSDDAICGCNVSGTAPMTIDANSPTGMSGGKMVVLPKLYSACDDQTHVFAEPGQNVSKASSSFKVRRIAVRDLRPTGRRTSPTSSIYDEYTGAVDLEFEDTLAPSRTPRSFKTSKIFTTTPDGQSLKSCVADMVMRMSTQVTNSPYATSYLSAIAECPVGYTVISGAFRASGADPTCPLDGTGASPAILESAPVVTIHNLQGWKVTAACQSIVAFATCRRGHQ